MVQRCSNGVAFLVLEPEPSIRTGIRVDIYDGNDPATLLAVLPDTWDRNWLDPLRGTGSGGFSVALNNPVLAANPGLLAYGNIARFSLDEVYRFAIQIEHKDRVQVKVGGDVERTLKVSGRGILSKLEDTALYPAGGLAGSPERPFVDVTPGVLMRTVVDEGQTRGALVGIQQAYTDTLDSNNAPYDSTLSVEERAGTSGLRIAERIQELAADIYMTPGGALRIVNERGVDRSVQLPNAGPVVLRPADNLEELTRSEDGSIRNALLIETPGGFLERSEGGSITEHSRREAYLSLGNMTDSDAIDRAADSVFQKSAQPAAEMGAAVADIDGARPYVDWSIGDWVLAPDEDDNLERFRVRALSVSEDDEGQPIFTPELATITEELEVRLERWLAAMSKGTIGGTAGAVAEPVKAPVEVVDAIDAGIGDHVAAQPHHDELSDLVDVDTTGLADRDILRYDAAAVAWEPEALNLDALDDVDLSTPPTNGQVLEYDAGPGTWKAATPSGGGGGTGTPKWLEYLRGRQPDETTHADDDFFADSAIGGTEVTVSGSATWTEKYDRLHVTGSGGTASDLSAILYPLTPNSAPVTIETAFSLGITNLVTALIGPVFTDGTDPTSNLVMAGNQSASSFLRLYEIAGTLTDAHVDVQNLIYTHHHVSQALPLLYLRLVWTAANTFAIALSHNGVHWDDFGAGTFAKTMTPSHFGVAVENAWAANAPGQVAFEYLRVYEADLSA